MAKKLDNYVRPMERKLIVGYFNDPEPGVEITFFSNDVPTTTWSFDAAEAHKLIEQLTEALEEAES